MSKVETQDGSTFQVTMDLKLAQLVLEHQGPMVLAVTKEVSIPRLVNIMGILAAEKKPLEVLSASDLDLDPSKVGQEGSPTRVRNLFMPEIKRRREIIKGEPEEVAEELVNRLHQVGML